MDKIYDDIINFDNFSDSVNQSLNDFIKDEEQYNNVDDVNQLIPNLHGLKRKYQYDNSEDCKTLKLKQMKKDAKPFKKGTADSIGYDIYSYDDVCIKKGFTVKISTGIGIKEIPKGYYCRLAERSSMSLLNLKLGGGVIDPDYTGEIIVILTNLNRNPVVVEKNQRIAQLILERAATNVEVECELLNEDNTIMSSVEPIIKEERCDNGFGSTGK